MPVPSTETLLGDVTYFRLFLDHNIVVHDFPQSAKDIKVAVGAKCGASFVGTLVFDTKTKFDNQDSPDGSSPAGITQSANSAVQPSPKSAALSLISTASDKLIVGYLLLAISTLVAVL